MPHIHEKIDFTAEVYVVCKDRVLLRFHDKYCFWVSVGGHVELHEDPNEAAVREVKEEVGLDITLLDDLQPKGLDSEGFKELIPPKSINRNCINDTHEHVSMVYYGRSESDQVIPEKPTDKWKWCDTKEVESMDLRADVRYHALKALVELA